MPLRDKNEKEDFINSLSRRKPVEKGLQQASCEKSLSWYDLTAYGIAATVGSGVYVTCGRVAHTLAGPSVVFSTAIAGLLSLMTGIVYLEFASSLPISGSGYAYFYTMLGEFLGWSIGWNLTLEYAFAAAAIAGGWTGYFVGLMEDSFGWNLPKWMYSISLTGTENSVFRINLLAALIVLIVGVIVSRGVKFGALFTNMITAVNIGIILFIVVLGSFSIKASNWAPFVPLGVQGISQGSGEMFFSFIGYDTISSLAAESMNPGRDLPIAVLLTVGTATTLYMAMGLVLTGMVKYTSLDLSNPLAEAFIANGYSWAAIIVSICALFTMAATIFACLTGQPKIFQAISKDGLMPKFFAREDRNGTPIGGVIFTVILTALVAGLMDVDVGLIDMISFGTLLGMSALCSGLLVVRFEQHRPVYKLGTLLTIIYFIGCIASSVAFVLETNIFFSPIVGTVTMFLPFLGLSYLFIRHREQLASNSQAFSCPLMPIIPCLAIAANTFFMIRMKDVWIAFIQFAVWTTIGTAFYFSYGRGHSHLKLDQHDPEH